MELLTESRFVEIDKKVSDFFKSMNETTLDEEHFFKTLQFWIGSCQEQLSVKTGVSVIELTQYHSRKVWRRYNPGPKA